MHRVARLYAVGDLRVEESDSPSAPAAGWSTVAVSAVGLCGSDLHWYTEGGTGEVSIEAPVVPGHELAGVALDGPFAGQRVAVDPAIPCGQCESCRAGHANLCPDVRFAGHQTLDGGLQERLQWPDELLVALPESLSDDAGALLEPLGVAIHAVRLAHVRPAHDVLVVGGGPWECSPAPSHAARVPRGSSCASRSSIADGRPCVSVRTRLGRRRPSRTS